MQQTGKVATIYKMLFVVLSIVSCQLSAQPKIVFSSGAMPNAYQPTIIKPILTEAFRRIGYQFEVEHYPASRSIILANQGQTDGDLNRVSNLVTTTQEKFTNLVRVEPAIMLAKTAIFTDKTVTSCTARTMKNQAIAYKRGRRATAKELASEVYDFSEIAPVSTDLQAFQMLAKGRVDYVQAGLQVGLRMIKVLGINDRFAPCFIREPKIIHSYIHIKHKQLLPSLEQALNNMKAEGVFDTLVQQATEKYFTNYKRIGAD